MNKEERQKKIKAKEESYYSLRSDLDNMLWRLKDLKGYRGGRSYAFKMLDTAINLALEQIRKDYDRYVIRIRRIDANEDVGFMQKALNREKIKNAELQKKIEEAKTSSGLFIDCVRKKLGI